jgi:uncharacterized protein YqhQ
MNVGGQAVIEGVMMRNKEKFAIAVRKPDGSIEIKKEKAREFPKFFSWPFVRGALGLWFTLYDGIRALIWSGNQQLDEDEVIKPHEAVLTMIFSFGIALVVFVGIPFFLTKWIGIDGVLFDLVDGLFRVGFFLGYILLISRMDDVKTLFAYHGAEHKSIACYEAGEDLIVSNVRKYSRFHPRCGTSFLVFVGGISILVFMLIPGGTIMKLVGRVVLIPVVAALGFEAIKLSYRFDKNWLVRLAIAPGLWTQRITTKEPTDSQIEVGIASLKAVLDDHKVLEGSEVLA